MIRHVTSFLVGAAAWVAVCANLQAADREAAQDALRKRLAAPAKNFVFFKASAPKIAAMLSRDLKVPVKLDEGSLSERLLLSRVYTLSVTGVSYKAALNLLLVPNGMDWAMTDEGLVITTVEVARTHLLRRTYPVNDLVAGNDGRPEPRACQELVDLIQLAVRPESWRLEQEGPGNGRLEISRSGGALVVLQTPQVLDDVEDFLAELRAARPR
jgi:hypothetical protein